MSRFSAGIVREIAERTGQVVHFDMLANCLILRGVAVLWLLVGLLLAGCAGKNKLDLKSQIGIITYDQVLLELGPPNHVADLVDGGKVAQWLEYSSRVYSTPNLYYGGGGPWFGAYGTANVNSTPNVYLFLTFGPDLKLVSVKHQYK